MSVYAHCQDCGRPLTVEEGFRQQEVCDVCLLGYDPADVVEEAAQRHERQAR